MLLSRRRQLTEKFTKVLFDIHRRYCSQVGFYMSIKDYQDYLNDCDAKPMKVEDINELFRQLNPDKQSDRYIFYY